MECQQRAAIFSSGDLGIGGLRARQRLLARLRITDRIFPSARSIRDR
jgi:hypothetical protein